MKRILTLITLIFFSSVTYAQLTGGAKTGINLASMQFKSDDQTETTDMVVGFQFGGYLNHKISETFIFQPELVFSRLGVKSPSMIRILRKKLMCNLKWITWHCHSI